MEYPIIDLITDAYINNGWTGLELTYGKNLLNPDNALFTISNAIYGDPRYGLQLITIYPGTYTLSISDNSYNSGLYVWKSDGTILVDGYHVSNISFVINETTNIYIDGYWGNNNRDDRVLMLEKGGIVTPYEPYTPPTTDIFSRTRLPLIRYFPHPVIDSLQRASDGTMTADDVQVLRHYLTKFGIGNIELGRFHAINPNISDDIREIDLEPIPIDDQIKEKKTGEEDLNVKTE